MLVSFCHSQIPEKNQFKRRNGLLGLMVSIHSHLAWQDWSSIVLVGGARGDCCRGGEF